MFKKSALFILFLAISFFLVHPQTLAEESQDTNSRNTPELEKIKPLRQTEEKLRELNQNRCEELRNKIRARINSFEANRDAKGTIHKNIRERLEKIISNLKGKGADTTKLEKDLKTLDTKIAEYWKLRDQLKAKLETAHENACPDTQTQFRRHIQESRFEFTQILNTAKEIREFITKTIIPDIKTARQEIRKTQIDENKEVENEN